jgi:alpha-glucosidase (family GH31 glycosyl hydrolase)
MNQFMLGDCIMVTPLLEKDKILITPYFPREQWFDYYSGL